jgi:hypothetical protein
MTPRMSEHLRAIVGIGQMRYGLSFNRRKMRHRWIRETLARPQKVQEAIVELGPRSLMLGGSAEKYRPGRAA